MFTGIVEELGLVAARNGSRLRNNASLVLEDVGEIVGPAPDLQITVRGRDVLRYVIEKASITVDGISLTIVKVLDDGFTVAVIPHTADVTTLGTKGTGELVNLEVDMTAKYV